MKSLKPSANPRGEPNVGKTSSRKSRSGESSRTRAFVGPAKTLKMSEAIAATTMMSDRAHGGYVAGERDADACRGQYPRKVGDEEREQDEKSRSAPEILGAGDEGREKAYGGSRGA